MQQHCGERFNEEHFAPFPLLIPFGWRPDPVIQEKKAPPPKRHARASPISKVFIGGLPTITSEDDLRNYFESFGPVASCDILVDAETRKSRGFGFIVFDGPVPDGVLGRTHCIHGKQCGTRMYGTETPRPDAYLGGYFPNANFRFDRYPKGKGKGEDAGRMRMQQQRPRRRGNPPTAEQNRDDTAAMTAARAEQPAAEPVAAPAAACD
jgi:hypothetical protein